MINLLELCWFLNNWNGAKSTHWTSGLQKQPAKLDIACLYNLQKLLFNKPFTPLWNYSCYIQPRIGRLKFSLETNSTVVWQFAGGVSLILRFGSISHIFYLHYRSNNTKNITPLISWHSKLFWGTGPQILKWHTLLFPIFLWLPPSKSYPTHYWHKMYLVCNSQDIHKLCKNVIHCNSVCIILYYYVQEFCNYVFVIDTLFSTMMFYMA